MLLILEEYRWSEWKKKDVLEVFDQNTEECIKRITRYVRQCDCYDGDELVESAVRNKCLSTSIGLYSIANALYVLTFDKNIEQQVNPKLPAFLA